MTNLSSAKKKSTVGRQQQQRHMGSGCPPLKTIFFLVCAAFVVAHRVWNGSGTSHSGSLLLLSNNQDVASPKERVHSTKTPTHLIGTPFETTKTSSRGSSNDDDQATPSSSSRTEADDENAESNDMPPDSKAYDRPRHQLAPGQADIVTTTMTPPTHLIFCDAFLRRARTDGGLPWTDPNSIAAAAAATATAANNNNNKDEMKTAGLRHYITQMQTHRPFTMSFHVQSFDGVRFGSYLQQHYYERVQETAWQHLLTHYDNDDNGGNKGPSSSQKVRVLDVGGNIGFYSLLSASMGSYIIDAFEPHPVNIVRFCESLVLNGWSRNEVEQSQQQQQHGTKAAASPAVNIHQLAVADRAGTLPFYENVNPGASGLRAPVALGADQVSFTVNVTTLDDFARSRGWLDASSTKQPKPVIAILKIDVEGVEAHVILGAKQLLRSGMVRNVFAETSLQGKSRRVSTQALQTLVDAGYRPVKIGAWSGPNHPFEIPANTTIAQAVIDAIEAPGRATHYLNILWSLEDRSFHHGPATTTSSGRRHL